MAFREGPTLHGEKKDKIIKDEMTIEEGDDIYERRRWMTTALME